MKNRAVDIVDSIKLLPKYAQYQFIQNIFKRIFKEDCLIDTDLYPQARFSEIDSVIVDNQNNLCGIIYIPFGENSINRLPIFPIQETITDFNKETGLLLQKIIIVAPDYVKTSFDCLKVSIINQDGLIQLIKNNP